MKELELETFVDPYLCFTRNIGINFVDFLARYTKLEKDIEKCND